MTHRPFRLALAGLALLSGACSSDDDPQAPASPQQYFGAEIEALPENLLAAAVVVRAAGYDSTYVEYQSGAVPAARTPAVGFVDDTLARIPVLGLDTATAYDFRRGARTCRRGGHDGGHPRVFERLAARLDPGHWQSRNLGGVGLPGPVHPGRGRHRGQHREGGLVPLFAERGPQFVPGASATGATRCSAPGPPRRSSTS